MWIVVIVFCTVVASAVADAAVVRAFRLSGKGKAPQWARNLAWALAFGLVGGVSQAIRGEGLWLVAACPAAAAAGTLTWLAVSYLIRRKRTPAQGQVPGHGP